MNLAQSFSSKIHIQYKQSEYRQNELELKRVQQIANENLQIQSI